MSAETVLSAPLPGCACGNAGVAFSPGAEAEQADLFATPIRLSRGRATVARCLPCLLLAFPALSAPPAAVDISLPS